jgi:hypothetical protein
MSYALPCARNHYYTSNAGGDVSQIVGKTYVDPKTGDIIQLVKNTSPSVLAGNQVVKWETPTSYAVDRVSASGTVQVAGVVDPAYSAKGKTVPINAAFWVVKRGPVKCIAGAVTTVNSPICTDAGASVGVYGRIQNAVASNNPEGTVFGTVYESGNAGDSVLCMVDIA